MYSPSDTCGAKSVPGHDPSRTEHSPAEGRTGWGQAYPDRVLVHRAGVRRHLLAKRGLDAEHRQVGAHHGADARVRLPHAFEAEPRSRRLKPATETERGSELLEPSLEPRRRLGRASHPSTRAVTVPAPHLQDAPGWVSRGGSGFRGGRVSPSSRLRIALPPSCLRSRACCRCPAALSSPAPSPCTKLRRGQG